ncbi:MAG: 7-carboxy-7-deazaguanine synthase QueE [Planctomycetota bacterium]
MASDLIEIFSAIQGEGPIVGRRQIFLRFGHCDVACDYCDTPLCHVELACFRAETHPGSREFESFKNPASKDQIAQLVSRLDSPPGRHHSVSLTGGEPLLHADTILALGPVFRERGLRCYLETNGHLVDELKRVLAVIDIIGMDIKIASTAGFPPRHEENRAFLALSHAAGREVFVKIVVGEKTTRDELEAALAVVHDVDPELTVVLQPVTPFGGRGVPPTPAALLELQDAALASLPNTLVIPQTHKMIKQK